MRKIVVGSFITLDGVMQAAGGPEEGFKYGGWCAPYYDEALDKIAEKQKHPIGDLLLGRKTFEAFASFWPGINAATKYVMI
jgi:dihydrofolate reductase